MAKGDHVFCNRFNGVYTHHGIDCGDGSVIHYTSSSWRERRRIERTELELFTRGDSLEVRDYEEFRQTVEEAGEIDQLLERAGRQFRRLLDQLRGIALEELDFSPEAVIARAESRLGESDFDLVYNNCEHFSAWCKTGISGSRQIDAVWRASMSQPRFMLRQTQALMTTLLDR